MIEQFGKDVANIEQTTIAESSKLMMQLMAVMRERLQKNKIFVDFDSYKPAEFKIELDGKEVYRGIEGTQDIKVDPSIEPKILTQITALLKEKEGNKVDIPYRNVSIKINDQEVFRVENGVVVFNALAIKEKNTVTVTADTGEAKNRINNKSSSSRGQIDSMDSSKDNTVAAEPKDTTGQTKANLPTPDLNSDAPKTTETSEKKPLNREEQLEVMASSLDALQLIEPLEKLVQEEGENKEFLLNDTTKTIVRSIEYKNYRLLIDSDNGVDLHIADMEQNNFLLFHKVGGKIEVNSLTSKDLQELDNLLKLKVLQEEKIYIEKEEQEID